MRSLLSRLVAFALTLSVVVNSTAHGYCLKNPAASLSPYVATQAIVAPRFGFDHPSWARFPFHTFNTLLPKKNSRPRRRTADGRFAHERGGSPQDVLRNSTLFYSEEWVNPEVYHSRFEPDVVLATIKTDFRTNVTNGYFRTRRDETNRIEYQLTAAGKEAGLSLAMEALLSGEEPVEGILRAQGFTVFRNPHLVPTETLQETIDSLARRIGFANQEGQVLAAAMASLTQQPSWRSSLLLVRAIYENGQKGIQGVLRSLGTPIANIEAVTDTELSSLVEVVTATPLGTIQVASGGRRVLFDAGGAAVAEESAVQRGTEVDARMFTASQATSMDRLRQLRATRYAPALPEEVTSHLPALIHAEVEEAYDLLRWAISIEWSLGVGAAAVRLAAISAVSTMGLVSDERDEFLKKAVDAYYPATLEALRVLCMVPFPPSPVVARQALEVLNQPDLSESIRVDVLDLLETHGWDPSLANTWRKALQAALTHVEDGDHSGAILALLRTNGVPDKFISEAIRDYAHYLQEWEVSPGLGHTSPILLALSRRPYSRGLEPAWDALLRLSSPVAALGVQLLSELPGVRDSFLAQQARALLAQSNEQTEQAILHLLMRRGATRPMRTVWDGFFGVNTRQDAQRFGDLFVNNMPSVMSEVVTHVMETPEFSPEFIAAFARRILRIGDQTGISRLQTYAQVSQVWRPERAPFWETMIAFGTPTLFLDLLSMESVPADVIVRSAEQIARRWPDHHEGTLLHAAADALYSLRVPSAFSDVETHPVFHRKVFSKKEQSAWRAVLLETIPAEDPESLIYTIGLMMSLPGLWKSFLNDRATIFLMRIRTWAEADRVAAEDRMFEYLKNQPFVYRLNGAWNTLLSTALLGDSFLELSRKFMALPGATPPFIAGRLWHVLNDPFVLKSADTIYSVSREILEGLLLRTWDPAYTNVLLKIGALKDLFNATLDVVEPLPNVPSSFFVKLGLLQSQHPVNHGRIASLLASRGIDGDMAPLWQAMSLIWKDWLISTAEEARAAILSPADQIIAARYIEGLARLVSERPEGFEGELGMAFADALALLGPTVGSHLETALRAAEARGLMSVQEMNRIMIAQSRRLNPEAHLPTGHLGNVHYGTQGYLRQGMRRAVVGSIPSELWVTWHDPFNPDGTYDLGRYQPVPPAQTEGYHRMRIHDSKGRHQDLIGYLGREVAPGSPEGVHPRHANSVDSHATTNAAEDIQIYRLGDYWYARNVKRIAMEKGDIMHAAFLGFASNLALAYYQIIETGAVFNCCIDASLLRGDMQDIRTEIARRGGPTLDDISLSRAALRIQKKLHELREVIRHPDDLPGYDLEKHGGYLHLTEEEIEHALPSFRQRLIRFKHVYPDLFERHFARLLYPDEHLEDLPWDRFIELTAGLPELVDDLFQRADFEWSYAFYELFPMDRLPEVYLMPIFRAGYTLEGLRWITRYLAEHDGLAIETNDLDDLGAPAILNRLNETFRRYYFWSQILQGSASLFTYNEVNWVEAAGVNVSLGHVHTKNGWLASYRPSVSHTPIFSIIAEATRGIPAAVEAPSAPFVSIDVEREMSQSIGLKGRTHLLSQGDTARAALETLGIASEHWDRFVITSGGTVVSLEDHLFEGVQLRLGRPSQGLSENLYAWVPFIPLHPAFLPASIPRAWTLLAVSLAVLIPAGLKLFSNQKGIRRFQQAA